MIVPVIQPERVNSRFQLMEVAVFFAFRGSVNELVAYYENGVEALAGMCCLSPAKASTPIANNIRTEDFKIACYEMARYNDL